MNIASHYRLTHFIPWSRRKIYLMLILSIVPTSLFFFFHWTWLAIPWVPVALLGTATAFISGFRNTETYHRTWEARKALGHFMENSRSFGFLVLSLVRMEDKESEARLHQELIYRHLAWITALRFRLRKSKPWENVKKRAYSREYLKFYTVAEWEERLEEKLAPLLPEDERKKVLSSRDVVGRVVADQYRRARDLEQQKIISEDGYIEMLAVLKSLNEEQEKCEQIKNFPYPRQFTSISLYFTNALCLFIPLGFIGAFSNLIATHGSYIIWLTVPISVLIGWVFLVLEQIGESTENPFEGGANDVPLTQLSRSTEISLRELLNEEDLPERLEAENNMVL